MVGVDEQDPVAALDEQDPMENKKHDLVAFSAFFLYNTGGSYFLLEQ